MSLHTEPSVHGRQVARHTFCEPRFTEWRKRQNVEKRGDYCHVNVFIDGVR